jgi:fermentation-respiration switch protein FrsA (DUF1100 family)
MMVIPVVIEGGGPDLAGDLFLPSSDGPLAPVPGVVAGSGFGGVKEMLLPHFAAALAGAGIATLLIDYAGFGGSAGEPRQDLDPKAQLHDLRRALDFLDRDRRIDSARLGVFGPSMCGAHALAIAGLDPRVQAAVSMVPFVKSPSIPPNVRVVVDVLADAVRRARSLPSRLIAVAGPPGSHAVMTTDGALDWIQDISARAPTFRNEVTVRSLARVAVYRPMRQVGSRGIRVPLRVILSTSDTITPARVAREELRGTEHDAIEFPGTHFELFGEHLPEVTRSTVEWFVRHLCGSAARPAVRSAFGP